jgi:hypothetical protein
LTWGFLIYPEGNDEEENFVEDPMTRVLIEGILPLAEHYFQGCFSHRRPAHQVYCQLFKDLVKEQLKKHVGPW